VRQTQTRTIDGQQWTVTQFPATVGLRVASRLLKLISGPVGDAVSGIDGNLMDARISMDAKSMGAALKGLAGALEPDDVVDLAVTLLEGARCDSTEISRATFDVVFQGRYGTLLKALAFVVEVNFQIPLADWFLLLTDQQQTSQEKPSIQAAS
jgi:hypothetical protein